MLGNTVKTIRTGKNSAVTSTPSLLTTAAVRKSGYGVIIKAPISNGQNIFVGVSSSITPGTTDATDGFLLEPGERIQIDIDDPGLLYVVATSGTQTAYWLQV